MSGGLSLVSLKPIKRGLQVCQVLVQLRHEPGHIGFVLCHDQLFELVEIEGEGGLGLLAGAESCLELRGHLIQERGFIGQVVIPMQRGSGGKVAGAEEGQRASQPVEGLGDLVHGAEGMDALDGEDESRTQRPWPVAVVQGEEVGGDTSALLP